MKRPVAVLASILCWGGVDLRNEVAQSIEPVELMLGEVADSVGYSIYSYGVSNPAGSEWALATFSVDVAASSGTPTALTATGGFLDATVISGATQPLSPFAQVGPISPGTWWAGLSRTAELSWAAPSVGPVHSDSVSPGDTLWGFGLRTTYLPGLSEVVAMPTWQSCCSVADTIALRFPRRASFVVTSWTVAPRYRSEEVTIALLREQFDAVCHDPLWIDDAGLCTEFEGLLDLADSEEDNDNFHGVAALLGNLLSRVEEERADMHANAYWLLSLNVAQARENALTEATSAANE